MRSIHSFRQPRKRPQNHPFTTMHPARFFFAPFVIVAAEMQNAMDQQPDDFLIKGLSSLSCLSPRRRRRDYHIAQHIRHEGYGPALSLSKGVWHASFPHGKG